MSPRPYSPELRAATVADYQAGMTLDEIAAARGVGASTVGAWVKAAGVPIRAAKRRAHITYSHQARPCAVEGCDRKHRAKGYCGLHYGRYVLGHQPLDRFVGVRTEERLEDCRWMAECGEHLTGAANRLGITRNALDTWLRKYDPDTLRVLTAREAMPVESRATFHGVAS